MVKKNYNLLIIGVISVILSCIFYPISEYDNDSNTVHHYINDENKLLIFNFLQIIIYFVVIILFFKIPFDGQEQ